jgi:EAL domain-containing protein (putative c-di-GMP-specific phosphodiesterase class I)
VNILKSIGAAFSKEPSKPIAKQDARRCSISNFSFFCKRTQKVAAPGAAHVALSRATESQMPTVAGDDEKRSRSERKASDFAQQYLLDTTKGNVFLLYQPIVSSHTGELAMVEGLVRWNDSRTDTQRGAPEVLHAAAMTDTLFDLTRITIERGMADLAAIHEAGLAHVGLAINLNPEQLCDDELVPFVRKILSQTHIDPHHLTLEVTEDAILHDEDIVVAQLRALDQLGVSLAIDDFGVGFSSLARLQKMPFDSVKIDKIFLENVPASDRRSQFYKAIVDFIHAVGIEPVAEGVETEAQRKFVRDVGCGMLQGFAESTPLPLHSLLKDYAPLRSPTSQKIA